MIGTLTSRIYLISPGRHGVGFDLVEAARVVFEEGVRLLQVREPHLKDPALSSLVEALLETARQFDARVILNAGKGAGLRVARRLKLPVHLDAAWPLAGVRKELQGLEVSVTVHRLEAVQEALREEVSSLLVGPVFGGAAGPLVPLGISGLRQVCEQVPVPIYVFGGISLSSVQEVLEVGVTGVALRGQVFATEQAAGRGDAPVDALADAETSSIVQPGSGRARRVDSGEFQALRARLRAWREASVEV